MGFWHDLNFTFEICLSSRRKINPAIIDEMNLVESTKDFKKIFEILLSKEFSSSSYTNIEMTGFSMQVF